LTEEVVKMRKFAAALAVVAGLGTAVSAQETNISVDGSIDALSGYIWRGGILGSDEALVFQPSLTFGFGESGVALNIWGSAFAMDRSTPKSTDQVDELDFTLSYDTTLGEDGKVGLSIGFIEYTFPSLNAGKKHSEEVYGGLSFDHQLAPSITVYYDFGLIDDYYVTAGIGPEFPLSDSDTAPVLGLGASVGISGDKYGGSAGFNDVTLTASLGFARENISFAPYVGYSYADDGINADNSSFWCGISIGFSK
jgi:hypothetical protein